MKKVKFMLLSLALVAVVGGALAFKVKAGHHFCTTLARAIVVNGQNTFTCKDAAGANLTCPNPTISVTIGGSSGNFYCTTPDNNDACDAATICQLPLQQTVFDGD